MYIEHRIVQLGQGKNIGDKMHIDQDKISIKGSTNNIQKISHSLLISVMDLTKAFDVTESFSQLTLILFMLNLFLPRSYRFQDLGYMYL